MGLIIKSESAIYRMVSTKNFCRRNGQVVLLLS